MSKIRGQSNIKVKGRVNAIVKVKVKVKIEVRLMVIIIIFVFHEIYGGYINVNLKGYFMI